MYFEMDEQNKFYQMYEKELEGIQPCTREEIEELSEALEMGDQSVGNRLIEGNLEQVIEIAKNYADQGVVFSDLVQEGNMALTMAVYEYEGGSFLPFAQERIEQAMEAAIQEQKGSDSIGEKMAAYINVMNEVTARLTEELGLQVTVEEVAEKMQISVDEVKELMKTALNAI